MCAGVLGGLSLWNCDLDFVSLGCLVLAIGLAIDFTAHVCYSYSHCTQQRGLVKMRAVMEAVAWPISQAALATTLGVLPLAFVPAYMVRLFFKTVVLVVLFGLLHALVWLPQMLILFDSPLPTSPLRAPPQTLFLKQLFARLRRKPIDHS